jgi:large conductance mechanosensitive channel
MLSEFKQFLLKANVLALALAFILGVALAAVVNSLVKDILLPPVGLLFGGVDFNNLLIDLSGKHPASLKAAQDAGLATINYGVFINTVITFIVVAFVVFLIGRTFVKPVPTKVCPRCAADDLPMAATRCPHCTSDIAGEAGAGAPEARSAPATPLRSPR